MERYDYMREVYRDAIEWLKDNGESLCAEISGDAWEMCGHPYIPADEFERRAYDAMEDDVTGNLSGSYTMNTWTASEYIAHNWALLEEIAEVCGIPATVSAGYEHGAEWWDVCIRCYILDSILPDAIKEAEDMGFIPELVR